MASRYDAAVAELYQAPHGSFTAERKRLAAELGQHGDKAGAATLAKLPRPTISAWAVNQLWWHAKDAFDALLDTAARLRKGDLRASAAHREAIAKLRSRAAAMLSDAGHGTTEATLRRVTTTLSALAATGGFDPDPPGAIAADRDPPGFEAVGILGDDSDDSDDDAPPRKPDKPDKPTKHAGTQAKASRADAAEDKQRRAAEERQARAEAAAERRRAEQAEAARKAQRHRLEAALRTARGDVERRTRELGRLRDAITGAEAAIDKAQAVVDDLEAKLAEL